MTDFNDIILFKDKTLADIFKQAHKNNKDTDKKINDLVDLMRPLITNAGSAVMLMPTVKDLLDVNVKNNEQLIKMAAIAQRGANSGVSNNGVNDFYPNPDEIQALLAESKAIEIEGSKLLDNAETKALLDNAKEIRQIEK